jgi:hypothetical protein
LAATMLTLFLLLLLAKNIEPGIEISLAKILQVGKLIKLYQYNTLKVGQKSNKIYQSKLNSAQLTKIVLFDFIERAALSMQII